MTYKPVTFWADLHTCVMCIYYATIIIIIIIIGTLNSNDRIAATIYSLGTWFVSGIYV
jgi:hypothetical protein